jgi:hypothetical protein
LVGILVEVLVGDATSLEFANCRVSEENFVGTETFVGLVDLGSVA